MAAFKIVNLRGDLFATAASFALQAVIRLGSSMILTRYLNPEAYGIITIILSIAFVIELLADINVTLFIIRDENGEQPRYLNTAWTMRLGRAVLNSAVLFVCAPVIASWIYGLPALTVPLRVFSVSFIIGALQSMSFPVAIRRKRARVTMYSDLASMVVSTVFTLIYCYYSRDYWGIVYGMLLQRALMSALSYLFFRELRPRLQFDWAAARQILGFTKYVMPSSLLTLALNQFDKIVFLRLFDLQLLGVYGLAGNIAGHIETLVTKISQSVLYPRCAHNFRTDPENSTLKYYAENVKLFTSILVLPAAVCGAAHLVVSVLYPKGYAQAGTVLQAFMVRATLLALASPSEDLLIASGEYQVILHGNIFRAITMITASLFGYHFFGFLGFTYGTALSGLPPLAYYLWLQSRKGMMIAKYEVYKVIFVVSIAASTYLASRLVSAVWPVLRMRI
jgi:O-antigen/teichoic acid export membrane protein